MTPAYRHTVISFPRAVLVTFVIGLTAFSCGSVLMVITLQLLLLPGVPPPSSIEGSTVYLCDYPV
jgi:hypothetical protein